MKHKQENVALLEDDDRRAQELEKALSVALGPAYGVVRLGTTGVAQSGAYEDRLLAQLHKKNLVMIVTDRDLSRMPAYSGLSEAAVSRVASKLHLPLCVYATGKSDSFIERQRTGGSGRIILDPRDPQEMARRVRVLADGFGEIRRLVAKISRSQEERAKYRGPASVLAAMLEAPEVVDHLALYTRGDQSMVNDLIPVQDKRSALTRQERTARAALALGVWLYDSVLRFPGIVLDTVAASSFLGIAESALLSPRVAKIFQRARYHGPFDDETVPRWWRHRLVELIGEASASDGNGLVKGRTGRAVPRCVCSVDRKAPAGYVCVMTNAPVCDVHSVAGISWLPRGADLARVRRDLFDEVGPWIGMS